MQVCSCADRNVQRVGPDREVRAADPVPQADQQEGHDGGNPGAVLVHPGLLLHGQLRRPGLHDLPDLLPGANQRVPHRVRAHGGAQGVQGPRAERARERASRLPPWRPLLRRRARLAVAHRQGLVIPSPAHGSIRFYYCRSLFLPALGRSTTCTSFP